VRVKGGSTALKPQAVGSGSQRGQERSGLALNKAKDRQVPARTFFLEKPETC